MNDSTFAFRPASNSTVSPGASLPPDKDKSSQGSAAITLQSTCPVLMLPAIIPPM